MEKLLCGIDLGGTKLSVGLVNPEGKIIDKIVVYDPEKNRVQYIDAKEGTIIIDNSLFPKSWGPISSEIISKLLFSISIGILM